MSAVLRLALAIPLLPACSILFEPGASQPTDLDDAGTGDAGTGDAAADLEVYDFTDGLDPWVSDSSCERQVDTAGNAIVCCSATGGTRSRIALAIPPSRAVEIEFNLLLTEQSEGIDPEEFSPLAALNNSSSTDSSVLANLNAFPDLSFGVASIPGAGTNGSDHTRAFRIDTWFHLRFTAGADVGCSVKVAIEDDDEERIESVSIPITMALEPSFSHVILGVFRQKTGAGRSIRCFDDITVRQLDSCP